MHASARAVSAAASWWRPMASRLDRVAGGVFILPAVVVILAFSIFPLLTSLYVSLSRLGFAQGGVELKFVGFDNYAKLLFGIDRPHFLGVPGPLTPIGIAAFFAIYAFFALLLYRYARGPNRPIAGRVGGVLRPAFAGPSV